MMWYLRLAWRNARRHGRRSILVVGAMAMGLALMMFYDGLIVGFEQAIYGNAIRVLGGNLQIHAPGFGEEAGQSPLLPLPDEARVLEAVRSLSDVRAASRRVETDGLASSREGAFGVSIIGIEPEAEEAVNLAARNIVAGRYLKAEDEDVALLGRGLAEAMGLDVGDRFSVAGRARHEQLRNRTLAVIGIYDLGLPDIERRSLYVSLAEAERLYGMSGQATEVIVHLDRLGREAEIQAELQAALPDYNVTTWDTSFPELQRAIGTKSGAMDVFSVIIMLIAAIGILNLLLMAVYERTREIGILGALGLRPRQISLLFILEGTLLGLIGVAAGVLLGLAINGIVGRVGLDYAQFAGLTEYTALISGRVYPTWGTEKLLGRALTVAAIAALAAFYPAREASQREPAEALHQV
jgi:ABC-type lipoprotein release transport system permease subunit